MTTPRRKPRHVWVVEDKAGLVYVAWTFHTLPEAEEFLRSFKNLFGQDAYRVAKYVRADSK